MNDEIEFEDGAEVDSGAQRPPMAIWKKVVLVLSLVLGVSGAFGMAAGGGEASPQDAAAAGAGTGGAVQPNSLGADGTFLPGQPGAGEGAEGESAAPDSSLWAPLFAKGGLSFFVAFCIGFALRTFLKITMLVIGVTALAVFGLQSAGIVGEIDWAVAEEYWDGLTENLGAQFAGVREFVTGSLPSAAAAGFGLVTGFRR